ncbi:MAG: beta-galactosidase trimerization domain-containing protein [Bryobacteraceae bacterium]|nr:beta-galactosidase trimerization domain-containing protein [Bryobacterales bacterium]MEB2359842.1 beta-galactosidase trimerization domain-containing protein [Bryobacterales bacterium]NUN00150.1 beta-galactosidase trimerization domain-containing protein [Bryobacteraceae bacterium]
MILLKLLLAGVLLNVPVLAQIGNATWATPVKKDFAEPAWWDQGVVFVGNWEPLVFRLRRGGNVPENVEELYRKEHTEETVLKLKQAGVNMILTHFYKTGLDSEREDVELAKQLGVLCHKHGMKLGTYIGGTIFAETLLRDLPEAKEWIRYDEYGNAIRYSQQTYRYRPDFNHPGYVEYMKRIARIAVEEVKTDFIHFDNHALIAPPHTGNTPEINRRFREFLRKKYTPELLKRRFGFADISAVTVPAWHNISRPATISPVTDPVMQEWVDFRCADLAAYYGEVADYIRKLNPNVLVELNPHGIYGSNRAFLNGIDHARLVPHGSVFWSEEPNEAQVDANGILVSKIRSMKLARSLDQTLFSYTGAQRADAQLRSYRLLMAESLAFNRNSLGDLGSPLSAYEFPGDLLRYVRFYLDNNRYYSGTRTVADVAILRSFPSMAYNSAGPHLHTTLLEQLLIQYKVPFDIIFDQNLADLSKYRTLVLGDQEALSDRALGQIRDFVKAGGGLVATGRTSLYNDWRRVRNDYGLADVLGVHSVRGRAMPEEQRGTFGKGRTVYVRDVVAADPIPGIEADAPNSPTGASGFGRAYWKLPRNSEQLMAAIRYVNGAPFAVEFEHAPLTTVMEITEKKDGSGRMLHWVNYRLGTPVPSTTVSVSVPSGKTVQSVEVISPDSNISGKVKFTVEKNKVRFQFPALEVYNVALINY